MLKRVIRYVNQAYAVRYLKAAFQFAIDSTFNRHPPILIYQMGKVGSSTVYSSLRNACLPNPIYKPHFLSRSGIAGAENYYSSLGLHIPGHIVRGKALRRQINRQRRGRIYKIITLVRDPIAREVSDFFQNIESHWPGFIDESGRVRKRLVIQFLRSKFMDFEESRDYGCNWFDQELKEVFDVDVYDYPFNYEDGFVIIRESGVQVLILRLENLNGSFRRALAEFLDVETGVELVRANVSKDKKYSAAYKYVLENITIPTPVCTNIYSTRYASHFYSEGERREFIRDWSEDNTDDYTLPLELDLFQQQSPGFLWGDD